MVGYVLVFLLGVVFGGVGVAFFCMAADMSSVRPSGEVLDFTPPPRPAKPKPPGYTL